MVFENFYIHNIFYWGRRKLFYGGRVGGEEGDCVKMSVTMVCQQQKIK